MRFLVLSDVHSHNEVKHWANAAIEDLGARGVIILGDITHFGPSYWAEEFISSLEAPVFAIPGNCDPLDTPEYIEAAGTLLHGRRVEVAGETFIGLGGSNPTIFDTPFEMSEEDIDAKLRPLMVEDAVLITHTPPHGINDLIHSGLHVGSTAIAAIVDEYRPKLVLSGHVHEARGIVERNGTILMNPGAAKDSFAGLLDIGDRIRVELLDRMA